MTAYTKVLPLVCGVALGVLAADRAFTSYTDAKTVLDQPAICFLLSLETQIRKSGEPGANAGQSHSSAPSAGDLDSMVNLLLYGTSFTKQPRIKVEALTEAAKAGILRARVDDLVAGLRSPGDNERLNFLNGLLRSQGIDPTSPGETACSSTTTSSESFRRVSILAKRAEEAKRLVKPMQTQPDTVPDPAAIFSWRPGLLRDRGVSLDTGIFPNFSIEQTLRDLKIEVFCAKAKWLAWP
jgi:hypothetical protein